MSLFIDYRFLFEVQLLCSSLHIEVLSFEDSEWSRGREKMECQVEKLEHFRHIIFEFNRGVKAAEATKNICAVYGDNVVGESTPRKRVSRFTENRFDISVTPRSGTPSASDEDHLNILIHNDPRHCTRELANVMDCDQSTIVRHSHSMGKVKKSGVWVPHGLKPIPQKISGWPYVHLCSLVIDWLVSNVDYSYPISLLVRSNGVFMLT